MNNNILKTLRIEKGETQIEIARLLGLKTASAYSKVKSKMPNITAKTSSNVFYKARCEAATHKIEFYNVVLYNMKEKIGSCGIHLWRQKYGLL